jgi:ubiquitin-conjugating enzyme E2 C
MTLMLSTPPGISAFPSETSLLQWTATIEGPKSTPYEGLTFKLSFEFPNNYPYSPPTVLFKTPIYHPNVDFSGRICLDILKDKWSAVLNVQSVLLSLQSLLGEPNKYVFFPFSPLPFRFCLVEEQKKKKKKTNLPDFSASPLNGQAAEFWDNDPAEFKRQVLLRHRDLEDDE